MVTAQRKCKVRRAASWLLIAFGLAAAGACATFLVSAFGWQIQCRIDPLNGRHEPVHTSDRGAWVTSGWIWDTAGLARMAVNSEPPALPVDQTLAVFNEGWADRYADPVLAERTENGTKTSWISQPGEVVHLRGIDVIRSGWPMRAFYGVFSGVDVSAVPPVRTAHMDNRGIYPGSDTIVLLPIPFGIAVDVVFYSGLLACAIYAPLWAFRRIRRRGRWLRRECLACGYRLPSRSAKCAECGKEQAGTK